MAEAVIVSVVRTPVGVFGGTLIWFRPRLWLSLVVWC